MKSPYSVEIGLKLTIRERREQIDALYDHALEIDECGDWDDLDEIYEEIYALEAEVDALERELV